MEWINKSWDIHIMNYNPALTMPVLELKISTKIDPENNAEWKNKRGGKWCTQYK